MMRELFELIARHRSSAKRHSEEDGAAIMKRVNELLALEKLDSERPSTEVEDDKSSG